MSKMLNVIGIIGVLLLVSLFGCSKESHSKDQVIENSVSSGIQQNDDDSGHFTSSQDNNAIKESEPVEKKVETPQEPSLLEQGVWSLMALVEFCEMPLLQLRIDAHGGFIANLFISEDSISMVNESRPIKFSEVNVFFNITAIRTSYKNKTDWQNETNGDSSPVMFDIPKQQLVDAILRTEKSVHEILLNCYFNNDEGHYTMTKIETLN